MEPTLVGDRKVEVAVIVEVARRDRPGSPPDGELGRLPAKAGTIAAEQHRHSPEAVGYRQVGILVTVEVAHSHRHRADGQVRGLAG